jgi:hypothetical protein
MHRVVAFVFLLLGALSLTGSEAPPAKPAVEELIEKLSANDLEVRKAAERSIEALGPEALPALRKALAGKPSLEVSRRIEKWIPRFELAALSAPKKVTLHVTGRPLEEVIAQLAKQTGYSLTLESDADQGKKPYDFRFAGVPFWEALDTVCARAGMVASSDGKGLQLKFSDEHSPFVQRHGAFRAVGQGFCFSSMHQRHNSFGLVKRKPAVGRDLPLP